MKRFASPAELLDSPGAELGVGSHIRGTVSLVSASSRGESVEAVYGLTIHIADGARPACVAELVVLYS
jgi:hypothetical protein